MNNYLVIADDFTGANDTGVQIRRRGIPVSVVFSSPGADGRGSCVIDTESRFLPEAEAFQKISGETEKIPFGNFRHVIKKVDSTLRGNIGAETKALSESYKPDIIVFAPAFPGLGRTTVNRIHCLNGTPVSLTELSRDPKTPVMVDDIHRIMEAVFGEKAAHIDLETLRGGTFDPVDGRVFCFDAVSNDDMKEIVRIVLASKKRALWVGSAGLADSLLDAENAVPPALAVVASLSSATRAQARFAEKQGVAVVKMPLHAIIEKTLDPALFSGEAVSLLKEGRDVILLSSSAYSAEEYQKAEESARRAGLSADRMSAFTRQLMGRTAVTILENAKISGLFLSGGDIAMSCFECSGAHGSRIESEIAVGIPLMRLAGGPYDGLKVVTKAGAFGGEDAIFYGLRKLREP